MQYVVNVYIQVVNGNQKLMENKLHVMFHLFQLNVKQAFILIKHYVFHVLLNLHAKINVQNKDIILLVQLA